MAAETHASTQPCRITVVAGEHRFDIGLPADVPLAELLPSLAAGSRLPDRGAAGWALRRLTGPPLDSGLSAEDLGVRHGEVLYLRPSQERGPLLRVDDLVDAVGAAALELPGRWSPQAARAVAMVALAGVLAGGAAALFFAADAGATAVLCAAAVSIVLLLAAALADRTLDAGPLAPVLGVAATGYAFVAGYAALPAPGGGTGVLAVGCAAVLPACVLGALLVPEGIPGFAAVGLASLLGLAGVGTAALLHAPAAGAAAAGLTLAMLTAPVYPTIALRASPLPAPYVPLDRAELAEGGSDLPADRIADGTARADQLLSALVAGGALTALVAAPVLLARPGWVPPLLVGLASLALLMRARHHRARTARLWLYGSGLVLGALPVGYLILHSGQTGRLVATGALLCAALVAGAVVVRLTGPAQGRRVAPTLGRLADLAEVLTVIALLPVALELLGIYARVRQLGG